MIDTIFFSKNSEMIAQARSLPDDQANKLLFDLLDKMNFAHYQLSIRVDTLEYQNKLNEHRLTGIENLNSGSTNS